jgi:hypothetical protein
MNSNQRFETRKKEVAAKVIDGEAIIINLANGIYYSMDNTGALIWEMIENGYNLTEMADAISSRCGVDPGRVAADVQRLTEQLLEESLLVKSINESQYAANVSVGLDQGLIYKTPQLNIYRDMGDLLALDPPVPGLGDTPWKDPDSTDEPDK